MHTGNRRTVWISAGDVTSWCQKCVWLCSVGSVCRRSVRSRRLWMSTRMEKPYQTKQWWASWRELSVWDMWLWLVIINSNNNTTIYKVPQHVKSRYKGACYNDVCDFYVNWLNVSQIRPMHCVGKWVVSCKQTAVISISGKRLRGVVYLQRKNCVIHTSEHFRGELLTMGRYTNPACITFYLYLHFYWHF